ncbi:MAG: carboxypeptidase regulatory-like domain-containing protein [Deltaproteobacteria bacterium]|nr:carboxypeptidase regulatory-like domain-containing protein [Deltaproteobacteria bacterium]
MKNVLTDKSTLSVGDIITTNLSVAVWIVDDYTKSNPIGNVLVTIMDGSLKAVKNPSGYYVLNDLEAGKYEVVIESDFYFLHKQWVIIPHLDKMMPVVEITVTPKPCYPFPRYATLVRGVVSSTPQKVSPIANEDVEMAGWSLKTKTDKKGEFVFYFKAVKVENITIQVRGVKKPVKVGIEKKGEKISVGVITFP